MRVATLPFGLLLACALASAASSVRAEEAEQTSPAPPAEGMQAAPTEAAAAHGDAPAADSAVQPVAPQSAQPAAPATAQPPATPAETVAAPPLPVAAEPAAQPAPALSSALEPAPAQPAAVEPAPAAPAPVAAAPAAAAPAAAPAVASTPAQATPTSAPANEAALALTTAAKSETDAAKKLQFTASVALSAGVQTDDDMTAASTDLSLGVSWRALPKLTISAMLAPYVEMTEWPGDNRRSGLQGSFTYVRASAKELLKDESTGIVVGGAATYFLPITYNDLFTRNTRYGALGASLKASRTRGELKLGLGGALNRQFYANARPPVDCDPETLMEGASCPSYPNTNSWNAAWTMTGTVDVAWTRGPWQATGSLGLGVGYSLGPSSANEPRNTNDHANRRGATFAFAASLAYEINEHVSANVGLSNGGPQTSNGRDYSNFLFDRRYAAVSAGLDFTY